MPTRYNGFPHSSCSYPPAKPCGAGVTCSNGRLSGGGSCAANGPVCLPSASEPQLCPGGLGCAANGTSCKSGCSAPADCAASNQVCSADGKSCISDGKVCHNDGECPRFNACAPDGASCLPDTVLAAATARGVVPSEWTPEVSLDPQQLAAKLRADGHPVDAKGRVILDTVSSGSLGLLFDPARKNPVTGFRRCMDRIDQCRVETKKLDECVAAAPRCTSATPWLDDPGGWDCCPTECLVEYFTRRATSSPATVMVELADGACYPQLTQYLEGT